MDVLYGAENVLHKTQEIPPQAEQVLTGRNHLLSTLKKDRVQLKRNQLIVIRILNKKS